MNDLAGRLLEQAPVYRLWQAPFADQKFAPVLAHNQMERVRRVLDVGCGPGTNAKYFAQSEYLGVDINPDYIQDARQRYRREFVACDVRTYRPPAGARFDFVLVNSFLHHLNTSEVESILLHLNTLLTADGHVHISRAGHAVTCQHFTPPRTLGSRAVRPSSGRMAAHLFNHL